jgi:hypothetical protein
MPTPQEPLISESTPMPASAATPPRPVQVRAPFVRLPRQSPSIDE